jgi:hypothetical protein
MRQAHPILFVAAAATLAFGLGTAAHAQSITPPTVSHTMNVGETYTVNKSITLGPAGSTKVDLFFLADNTGSMGGIINNAQSGASAILGGLPSGYQFGVGSYFGDPVEGASPSYVENQALTTSKTDAQNGINGWFASGGGDTPEGNFFALKQVADNAGWRADAQRLIVWFGDAPAHTETTDRAAAIAALQAANAKVIAFNSGPGGFGIDGTYGADPANQASSIVSAVGGTLVNNFLSVTPADFITAVTDQISSATSTIDLIFGSTLLGGGLNLTFTCTDPLGCTDVDAGETRTFDLGITALTPGSYSFKVFAQGVDAFETDEITVLGTTTTPEPVSMVLLGTGLAGVAVVKRRRRRSSQQFA